MDKMTTLFTTVFVIDDDTASQFVSEKVIRFMNLSEQVILFENGEAALQYFDKVEKEVLEGRNLILLDLDMPVMNGFEFIKAIKNHRIYTENLVLAVLATTSSFTSKVQAIKNQGVRYYISKPLNIEKMEKFCSMVKGKTKVEFELID